jgi:hypothetical protein
MMDDSDKRGVEGAPRQKETRQDSRHERLKLALRDNLKRRKSQARERDDKESNSKARGKTTDAPSNLHEDALDDDTGRDRGE